MTGDSTRPSVCLSMIVRDVAECVVETLESVAPHIDSWVVVDTGSEDGTADVITGFMAEAGIPGEMHHRPWRDFAVNRTEALDLARELGRADWIWMMDADDVLVGDLDLAGQLADGPDAPSAYSLRFGPDFVYWRAQIFNSDSPWRYVGAVHEHPVCDGPSSEVVRLPGDYHVKPDSLGYRSRDPHRFRRDAELLATALEADPADARSAFYLAQSLYDDGDLEAARGAYLHRAGMAGWEEEAYYSLYRVAVCDERLGADPAVASAAYERAHHRLPGRDEAPCEAARTARLAGDFNRAIDLAELAIANPSPEGSLFVDASVARWRAREELAAACEADGQTIRAIGIRDALLADDGLSDQDREYVAAVRDACAASRGDTTVGYPAATIRTLPGSAADGEPVTVTITSCRRPGLFERSINSFINCCADSDLDRIFRWICVDNGTDPAAREHLAALYPFIEWVYTDSPAERHVHSMARLQEMVETRLRLHLEDDWEFFAPRAFITDAEAILADDKTLGQVVFNRNFATAPGGRRNHAGRARRTAAGLGYRLHEYVPIGTPEWERHLASLDPGQMTHAHWPHFSHNPSLIDTGRLAEVGEVSFEAPNFEFDFALRYAAHGLRTAYLEEIHSAHIGQLPDRTGEVGGPSAYELVDSSDAQEGDRRFADGGAKIIPPAAATLLVDCLAEGRIDSVVDGVVRLELDPPWPVVGVAFRSARPMELEVLTAEHADLRQDGPAVTYRLRFGPDLVLEDAAPVVLADDDGRADRAVDTSAAASAGGEVVAAWVTGMGELAMARFPRNQLGALLPAHGGSTAAAG